MGPAPPKSRSDVKPPLEPELRLSPPPLSAAAFLVALGLLGSARAVHIADNGDGTFTNPGQSRPGKHGTGAGSDGASLQLPW